MQIARQNLIGVALFGAAAILLWRHLINRKPQPITAAVTPDTSATMRQVRPATADGINPRFDKTRFKNTDTPAGAVSAANTILKDAVIYTALNPLEAIGGLIKKPAGIIGSGNPEFTNQYTKKYDRLIMDNAALWKVDARVIKQLLISESSMNPNAKGSRGELGLGQFLPATWADVAPGRDPLNPADAIWATGKYVRDLLNWSDGTYESALESYNGGIGNWQNGHVSDAAELYADKIIMRSGIEGEELPNPAAP